MAEIVEYRVDKTLDEFNLLVDFGLFNEAQAKEILTKREDFEYSLRRRNRTKLDYLKYIRFEVNILESLDKYKKIVLSKYHSVKEKKEESEIEDLDQKILFLQAKKLNDIIRSRSAHISSLFRKLTTKFQFDKKLWLAYIEFSKSRKWNSRVSAIYWRLLRVVGADEDIWLAAASHELELNKAYDTARGLYLRALRHHPKSPKIWIDYFKMEVRFMELVDQRAQIIFKTTKNRDKDDGDIWAGESAETGHEHEADQEHEGTEVGADPEPVPQVKTIEEDDVILSGHLPKIVHDNASKSLDSEKDYLHYIISILVHMHSSGSKTKGFCSLRDYLCSNIRQKNIDGDPRVSSELVEGCCDLKYLNEKFEDIKQTGSPEKASTKRIKKAQESKLDILYRCYETVGIDEARKKFFELEKSPKNHTLSLYVGMIQIECWQLKKESNEDQLNRVRSVYEKALSKFGKTKPKLWYELLLFEHENAKSLDDLDRVNQIYLRAQSTLEPSKVDQVIEKYTVIQNRKSNVDIDYSDYSDLDD